MDRREYQKQYMEKWCATPKGLKSITISRWKQYGLVDDYDKIYDIYLNTTHCELCNVLLTTEKIGGNQKHMDHCHRTNLYRNTVCSRCNSSDTTRETQKNQIYGHKGLSFVKKKQLWKYRKQYNGHTFQKMCKSKTQLLCFKFAYLILLNHIIKTK